MCCRLTTLSGFADVAEGVDPYLGVAEVQLFQLTVGVDVGGRGRFLDLDDRVAAAGHLAPLRHQEDHRRAQRLTLFDEDGDRGVGFQVVEWRVFVVVEDRIHQIDHHQQEGQRRVALFPPSLSSRFSSMMRRVARILRIPSR